MAAPTKNRVTGRDCVITVGSALSQWTSYTLETTASMMDARAASSTTEQRILDAVDAKLTVEGYRGVDEAFVDFAEVGSLVTSISGTDIPSDLLDTYGDARITRLSMSQSKEPGTYSMEVTFGFMDAPIVTP